MKLRVDYFTKCLLMLLFVVAIGSTAWSQRTITGNVKDDVEGLISATVLVVGTSTGTITDFDGNYSIAIPEGATQLEFSYTGYESQTIDIGTSDVIDVVLSAGQLLDEVVVVGYGTSKAKEVTSSVASVKAEDFNAGNISNPAQLLQGKVAGLQIAKPGGDPNGEFNIRLRGLSTVGANSQPLVIIDGVPGASLSNIDPADIESIDVLKDGSAAAIYGTRGSSGVILVTTKKGKAGHSSVEYGVQVSAETVAKKTDVASSSEFLAVGGKDIGSSTDWFGEITETGISQVHNLSLSGGTDQTVYRFSVNYRDINGAAVNTGFDQLNGRMSLTQKAFDDRLKFSFNLSATTRDAQYGFEQAFRYATIYNPTAPILDAANVEEGGYYEEDAFDYFNPVSMTQQNLNEGKDKRILASFRVDYELMEGLSVGATYSQQRESLLRGQYFSKFSKFIGSGSNGLGVRATEDRETESFEFVGNYTKDFDKLNFKALAGYSYQDFSTESLYNQGGGFVNDAFTFNNFFAGTDFATGRGIVLSRKITSKLVAFFGRVSLNYDDTYFFQASVRQEGSSKFGDNNKWGIFPAASAGVTLSNLFDVSSIDNLKLRVGYGRTGALPGDSYLSLQRVGPGNSFPINGTFVPSYSLVSNANPDLQWETKDEITVGIDFSLLDYKLTGSLEWYTKTTKDGIVLVDVPVPPNFFPQTWLNVGEIDNTGIELALNYLAIDNSKLTWETGITFSTFSTDLVSYNGSGVIYRANLGSPGQNGTSLVRLKEGDPLGQIWGIDYEGVFQVTNDDGELVFTDDGDPVYEVVGRDIDGDGDFCDCDDDRTVIGNGLPDFELGFTNSFTFGNFDFNFFLRGSFGHDMVNTFRAFYETTDIVNQYNFTNTSEFDPSVPVAPAKFNSLHVEDASFLKLDNATIGYNVPMADGSKFSKLRLYVSAQNLFVITNYTGVDPEVRFSDSGNTNSTGIILSGFEGINNPPDILAPGIDRRNTYFRTRTFTIGANVGF